MLDLYKNIRERRQLLNLTQSEVAAKAGYADKSMIAKIEKGLIDLPQSKIALFANVLQTTQSALMGWEEDTSVFKHNNVVPVPEMRQVPLFVGGIACGDPLFVTDETEYISVPKHIKADFAVVCKGDSMINARINDGDIVYIKQQPVVNNGQIAAVLIDDSATLKKVYLEKNRLTLMAANPDYPPMIFTGEELENIKILGLATAFTSSI